MQNFVSSRNQLKTVPFGKNVPFLFWPFQINFPIIFFYILKGQNTLLHQKREVCYLIS